ncbi:ABC transporter ATP-binding protein [Thioclava sp. GXIMD4216]|uniref:ABC transporter ATP-binding protein n=1 Tax=Thioclava sp. GXIMD4216 TaxID=3131929 RepID=UPI0030D3CFCB
MLNVSLEQQTRGRRTILAPMRFSLPCGRLTAVLGPNGAGKSTLLQALSRGKAAGAQILDGRRQLGPRDICYLPQAFAVVSELSVLDCVILGQRERLGLRVPQQAVTQARSLLDRLGLGDLATRAMSALSGGQQQRVLLAQRLFRGGRVMALDEPTSALDLHHQLAVLGYLRDFAERTGTAVVLSLHDLNLAARFCTHALLLAEGRLICEETPERALNAPAIRRFWKVAPEWLRDSENNAVFVPHMLAHR